MSVVLENVTKSFGDKTVLNNLSFTIDDGEKVAIMGDSGSGKTTLLRLLLGLDVPDSGYIHMDGKPTVLFQEDRLIESLSVISNLMLVTEDRSRALEMLSLAGLEGEERNAVSTLSGGMKRRLSLARTLLTQYDILLLDEPFNGLDPDRKRSISDLIRAECGFRTLILISHSEEEREMLGCSRIIDIEA